MQQRVRHDLRPRVGPSVYIANHVGQVVVERSNGAGALAQQPGWGTVYLRMKGLAVGVRQPMAYCIMAIPDS